MSIKLANVAQTEHKFFCFTDINKKDKYGIRRLHSMNIKCIDRSSRPDVFCKNVFLTNFTKFTWSYLFRSLFFNKVAGLGHSYFLLNFTKFLMRAIHYQINQIQFIGLILCIRFVWCDHLIIKSDKIFLFQYWIRRRRNSFDCCCDTFIEKEKK